MSTLFFPVESYKKHRGGLVFGFSFAAMILVAVSRYCWQLIFSEILNLPFTGKKFYEYKFNEQEISFLSKQDEEFFRSEYKYKVAYDFKLTYPGQKYTGDVEIGVNFVNKGSFQNSFYSISIESHPKTKLKLYPFFLTEKGLISLAGEFLQSFWMPIFCKIENVSQPKNVKIHRYSIEPSISVANCQILEELGLPADKEDFIKDVFFIVLTIMTKYSYRTKYLQVSTDDILSARALSENKNGRGFACGYKRKERLKVHAALSLLNAIGMLVVREVSLFNYIVEANVEQSALLPVSVCCYDYKNSLWEKRFARFLYLCGKNSVKVAKLYDLVSSLCTSFKPAQIRDKFEMTMDNLVRDKVILDWYYSYINEEELQGKNWLCKWLNLSIVCRY